MLADMTDAIPILPDLERRTTYSPVASAGPFDVGFDLYGDGDDYENWLRVFLDGLELAPRTEWSLNSPSGPISTERTRPIRDAQVTLATPVSGQLVIVGEMRPRRTTQLTEGRGVSARDFNLLATRLMTVAREYFDRIWRLEDQVSTQITDPTIAPNAVRYDVVQDFGPAKEFTARVNIGLGAVMEFNTLADYTAAQISAAVERVRIHGYYAAGDGGGFDLRRVSTEPAHGAKHQSADGGWGEIDNRVLTPRMFGARGDGVRNEGGAWSGTDDTAALKSWLNACDALGRSGDLDYGAYIASAPLLDPADNGGVMIRQNVHIYGHGHNSRVINKNPSGDLFHFLGTRDSRTSTAYYLTAPVVRGSVVLPVNDSSVFEAGQDIILKDNSNRPRYFDNASNVAGCVGEVNTVLSIDGPDQITVVGALEFDYGVNEDPALSTTLHRITGQSCNLRFHDFVVEYDQTLEYTYTHFALGFYRCRNVRVERVEFVNRRGRGIRFYDTIDGNVFDCRDIGAPNEAEYFIIHENASRGGVVRGNYKERGRHLWDAGGPADEIAVAHVLVDGNVSMDSESSGIGSHSNCRDVTISNNIVARQTQSFAVAPTKAGIIVRGQRMRVVNNQITGFAVGIYAVFGHGHTIEGNKLIGADIGVLDTRSRSTKIVRNRIIEPLSYGILSNVELAEPNYIYPAKQWVDNEIVGNPSQAGIQVLYSGGQTWRDDWVIDGNRIPDATTPYGNGVPARLYLGISTQTDNYTLTLRDGPPPGHSPQTVAPKIVEINALTAKTVTVPPHATVPLPVGTRIDVVQLGEGTTTIVASGGVALRSISGDLALAGQYASGRLLKRDLNDWVWISLGNITGPSSSTDGDFAMFDGLTGRLLRGGVSFDVDPDLAANKDNRVPSQKAIKTHVVNAIAPKADRGLLEGTNTQTDHYTLVISDIGKVVEINAATAKTLTVPPEVDVAFPVNTVISLAQIGAGQVTIAAGSGVTLRSAGSRYKLFEAGSEATLRKRAADDWVLSGDLTT